jgi:hypothetical protein
MADTTNNSIITVDTKKNPEFKKQLAYLARSDAHHDLKEEFKDKMYNINTSMRETFNSGLPIPATYIYHEADALAASIIRVGGVEVTDGENLKQLLYEKVPDCTMDNTPGVISKTPAILETGFKTTDGHHTSNGITLFQYMVVKFVINCTNNKNAKPKITPYTGPNFGKTFVDNTKLGGNLMEAAFIVDFSQHHFMGSLVNGAQVNNFEIHYLMTPEVVNDPAGKPNINNPSLFHTDIGGVKLISYIQTGINTTSYNSYDPNDPSPANNFFSRYNFTLSPIKQSFIKGKAQNLIAELGINYDDTGKEGEGNPQGKAPPLIDKITDSKEENSVSSVLGYLKDVIKKIMKKGASFNRVDAFSFNSKCQQKRGGDWFQVLSCLDVKNRDFMQILPQRGTIETAGQIPKCPVYLVTHDQIAVSYALLNGVNVIYMDNYGTIYVFKNAADPNFGGEVKPMEEILFEGLKVAWPNPEDLKNYDNPIVDLLTYGNTYTRDRNKYLDTMKDNFKTTCTEISTFLADTTNIDTIGKIQTNITKKMQALFTEAVTLMFAQMNLGDISGAVNDISKTRTILADDTSYEDTPEQNLIINKLSNAINNIQSVQNRFGTLSGTGTFDSVFSIWLTNTVEKLDVYRTANNILSGGKDLAEPKTFTLSRLVGFFTGVAGSGEEERKTDSHIFLPFIQSLDNGSRKSIIGVLTTAITVTETYGNILLQTPERKSRTGNMSPNQLYFNKMGNLIQEALIFVITDIESGDKYNDEIAKIDNKNIDDVDISTKTLVKSGMVSFESTDALLLETDFAELANFFAQLEWDASFNNYKDKALERILGSYGLKSKSSNYATEPNDLSMKPDIQSGGALLNYDGLLTRRPETPVFCDVSVKQITWALITSVLLNTGNKDSIDTFIEHIEASAFGEGTTDNSTIDLLGQTSQKNKRQRLVGGDPPDGLSDVRVTSRLSALANSLYDIHSKNNGDSVSPNSNTDLMLDVNLGFHPLVPIYAVLAPFFSTLGPKAEDDPFFYTYFTYINILEKMKSVIVTNYLSNTNNPAESASAYLIGFGLNTMLINSHTSILQNNEILQVLDMSQQEYFEFSLKNDSYAGLFSGSVSQDKDEEEIGISLVNNELFRNFINNEVNIREILQQGTPSENLPNYKVLQNRIFKLMGEIVIKVNGDRGTPIIGTDAVAAGVPVKAKIFLVPPERKTGIHTLQDYPSASKESDENIVNSTTSSTRSGTGGKKSRRNKQKKKRRVTRKQRKTYKHNTKKVHKKHKKTIKH